MVRAGRRAVVAAGQRRCLRRQAHLAGTALRASPRRRARKAGAGAVHARGRRAVRPKRPPIAAGIRADGTGVVRVARTDGIASAIASSAPVLVVDEVDVVGPPTSSALRAAGWAEAAVLLASIRDRGPDEVRAPSGAVASAVVDDERVQVRVRCGDPLDAVVLRSYCIGAAHMALGWVRSEGIAVDAAGEPQDLTIRSFGILRAVDTPRIEVRIEADDGPPVNGSDAVFAAVAAAAWRHLGYPEAWPAGRR